MKGSTIAIGLGAIVLVAVTAPWIATTPPDLEEDVAGARLLPPLAHASAVQLRDGRTWILTDLDRVEGGWDGRRGGQPVRLVDGEIVGSPSPRAYLLGTDALGRDVAGRLVHGVRTSVLVAGFAVLLALLLGTGVGALTGLAGGWTDSLGMRAVDVLLSVPRLLLFLLLSSLFRPSVPLLVVVLGATTWPGLARLVRAEIVARRRSDLTLAARASGCSATRTVLLHLLPQAAPVIAVTAALRFADTIVLESALSFLGLGAPPPAVSLGGMIAVGRDQLRDAWWVAGWPVLALVLLVMTARSAASRVLSEPSSVT